MAENPLRSESKHNHSFLFIIVLCCLGRTATAQILPPEIQWQQSFGGFGLDATYPSKPLALPDGGFLLPGISSSYTALGKTSPWYGSYDFWLIRTDAQGNEVWQRSYGGSSWDTRPLVAFMKDGNVLLAGVSGSTNDGNKTVT